MVMLTWEVVKHGGGGLEVCLLVKGREKVLGDKP